MGQRIVAVVGTRYPDLSVEEAVLAPLGVELRRGSGRDADDLVELAAGAEVILAGAAPRFDAATLGRLRCRGIVRYGVGVDSIDLDAARRNGIAVANVPDYGTEAVAIHAVTLALAGVRRLREADAQVRAGSWGFGELRPLHLPSALTAGVVGYGRIGRRVAGLLAGLGFRVIAYDALAPVDGVPAAPSLEHLLATADVVSLHVPGGPRPLLDAPAIARMKPGAVLVNTARGSLIDLDALAAGLRRGRPRVAALDVFPQEPVDRAAFTDDALILTPHMAWYTEQSERELRSDAAEAARRLLLGERPDHVVLEGAPA